MFALGHEAQSLMRIYLPALQGKQIVSGTDTDLNDDLDIKGKEGLTLAARNGLQYCFCSAESKSGHGVRGFLTLLLKRTQLWHLLETWL